MNDNLNISQHPKSNNDTSHTFQESPRRKKSRKSRWWIPVLIIFLFFIFIIIPIISFSWMVSYFEKAPVTIEDNSVLRLDLSNVVEYKKEDIVASLLNKTPQSTFYDIIKGIKKAKTDNRIKGIYYECLTGSYIPSVKANELQQVLEDFKKSGKFIYSYIEAGNENDYYNALPSDSIFVCEESLIEFNGFGSLAIFPKGLYDKLGIEYEIIKYEDFKSAGEIYSRKNFSDSARYQNKILIEQKENVFLKAVEKFRNIPTTTTIEYFNSIFYSANELIEKKLVDVIASNTDVKKIMYNKIFNKQQNDKNDDDYDYEENYIVDIDKYISNMKQKQPNEKGSDKNPQIAIIYGSGPIISKKLDSFIPQQETMIIAEDFIKDLKKAYEDDDIKAILIRIDSPGGSVIASEAIYQEILKAKKKKPVYASMSDVAASGGYYIAMACDTIIAHPQTITGSIGVIMALPNFSKALKKLDVNIDTISTGKGNPFGGTIVLPLKEKDKETLNNYVSGTYFRFVNKAAKSRNKTPEEMRKLAKGRVWTGEEAYKKGLVDLLGGFETSIELLKKRINAKEVTLQVYPKNTSKLDIIFDILFESKMSLKWFILNNYINNYINKNYINTNINYTSTIKQLVPKYISNSLEYNMNLINLAQQEKVLLSLPYYINIK